MTARAKKKRAPAANQSAHSISEERINSWLRKAQLRLHPWAAQIPRMSEEQFELHKEDIAKHGQRDPIWVKQGWLVDGLHRLGACIELELEPRLEQYPNDDLVEFILSENLFRRHLSDDQRAVLVAMALGPGLRAEAQARMKAGVADPTLKSAEGSETAHKIAKQAKVGRDKGRAALRIVEQEPKEAEKVLAGEKRLADAGKDKRRGTLLNGEDAEKVFKPEEFKKRVLDRLEDVITKLVRDFPKREKEAERAIVNYLLSKAARELPNKHGEKKFENEVHRKWVSWVNSFALPERKAVNDLVHDWTGPSEKTKRAKLQPVKSVDLTEAVIGKPSKKGGKAEA
jgi:hypothetical protein